MTEELMPFDVQFPDRSSDMDQDEEFCDVTIGARTRRIRFHDYTDVYAVPGLYEALFCDELKCRSPQEVIGLLAEQLERLSIAPKGLTALDLGAGNGMVGEQLRQLGCSTIVGCDILEAAEMAARRDRPEVYDDYLVDDLTDPSDETQTMLVALAPDILVTVAALGYGDIPPEAFQAALDAVRPEGFVAFCIKDAFLRDGEASGFAQHMAELEEEGHLEILATRRYRHRLNTAGEPLQYMAMVARTASAADRTVARRSRALAAD